MDQPLRQVLGVLLAAISVITIHAGVRRAHYARAPLGMVIALAMIAILASYLLGFALAVAVERSPIAMPIDQPRS